MNVIFLTFVFDVLFDKIAKRDQSGVLDKIAKQEEMNIKKQTDTKSNNSHFLQQKQHIYFQKAVEKELKEKFKKKIHPLSSLPISFIFKIQICPKAKRQDQSYFLHQYAEV